MSFKYWTTCSERARVKILFDEVKEFYVPGDTISGRAILTLLDPSYSYEDLCVYLRCQETCKNEKGDELVYTRWMQETKNNFDKSILALNKRSLGQVEQDFKIYLDPEIYRSLPPSFVADNEVFSAVTYFVSAISSVSERKSAVRPHHEIITDGFDIEFHPTDNDHPPANALLAVNAGLSPIRFRLPRRLPQWPAKFSVQVELDETSPVKQFDFIRMFLEKRVLIMNRSESAITYETTLLAELNDVTLSETNRYINTSCQLKKREPAGFSSYHFGVQYLFRAQYLCGFEMQECVIVVDVMPPSPKFRISSCRQLSRTPDCAKLPDYYE